MDECLEEIDNLAASRESHGCRGAPSSLRISGLYHQSRRADLESLRFSGPQEQEKHGVISFVHLQCLLGKGIPETVALLDQVGNSVILCLGPSTPSC
jgi:hypothetical protein